MATSLESQLKRLQAPQTSAFVTRKGRYSFLYPHKEAAGIDCDTHYSVALDGLAELIELDPGLNQYRDSLFSESSKSFERGVRSREENEKLDQEIECFLLRVVTPFFIRVGCHKVLEYLIYKYRVNEFNVDALLMSALPYHASSLFPKLLQSIPAFKDGSKKWSFLHSAQQQGSPIPASVLVNRCISEQWLLHLITDTTCREVTASDGKSGKFATFATVIFLGCLIAAAQNEDVIAAIQYFVDKGLSSCNRYFVLAAYTVASFTCCKVQFVESFVKKLLSRACRKFQKYEFRNGIVEEFVFLIAIVLDTQELDASLLLPDSAMPVLIANSHLMAEKPRVINALIRKLVFKLTDDKLEQMLILMSITGSSPALDRETVSQVSTAIRSFHKTGISLPVKVQVLQVVLCLLKSGHSSVKKLKSVVRDGEAVSLMIDQLTLIDPEDSEGSCHRIPFSMKKQEWQDVSILLELITGPKISSPFPLLESCQLLLRESLAYAEEAVYYRRLLLQVIHQIISADDYDWTGETSPALDTACIIDLMKVLRNQEGVKDCIRLIKHVAKYKRSEILDNYMRIFSFVGCKYGNCDDKVSLSLMNGILCDLVPSLTAGDETMVKNVIDSLIDNIFGVAEHRRLAIVSRFLHVAGLSDRGYEYVIFSLVRRSVTSRNVKMRKFYAHFCTQLLASLKLVDVTCHLDQLFQLLHHQCLHLDSAKSEIISPRSQKNAGGNSAGIETTLTFPSLKQLLNDDTIQRQDLTEAIMKIVSGTLASDDYVQKVLRHSKSNMTTGNNNSNNVSTSEIQIEGVSDGSDHSNCTPFISQLVDHVITTQVKGKLVMHSKLLHELIQNATLSLDVTSVMSLTARLLLQASKSNLVTSSTPSSNSHLMKLSIGMIWMNRDRINEWQEDRDNQLLFQCISSLACISSSALKNLHCNTIAVTAVTTSQSLSSTPKEAVKEKESDGKQGQQQELQLIRSALSVLKLLVRLMGEVAHTDERKFLEEMLLIFVGWIDEATAEQKQQDRSDDKANDKDSLIPWVMLSATQLLKAIGQKDGKKHVPRIIATLLSVLQTRSSLVAVSGMTSMSAVVQLFPESVKTFKNDILKKLPPVDSNLTGQTREDAKKFSQARDSIVTSLAKC